MDQSCPPTGSLEAKERKRPAHHRQLQGTPLMTTSLPLVPTRTATGALQWCQRLEINSSTLGLWGTMRIQTVNLCLPDSLAARVLGSKRVLPV